MNELRANSATALEAIKAEAKEREIEIKNEATRSAESAAAERIAAIETAQRESEVELQARINETEASRDRSRTKGEHACAASWTSCDKPMRLKLQE